MDLILNHSLFAHLTCPRRHRERFAYLLNIFLQDTQTAALCLARGAGRCRLGGEMHRKNYAGSLEGKTGSGA